MNVLLIGGTGVLSAAVTLEALKSGITVTMINRGRRRIPENVELIVSDNKNYSYIEVILGDRQFDAVIDFLCYRPEELKDSFEIYSKHTRQYFFISSCAVYDTKRGGTYDEDSPKVRKEWPYSVDKWACECLLKTLASKTNCQYTIIRPCLTYGDTRLPYGITPEFRKHWTLVARILAGKPIIRWNNGVNRWNMMRVEDLTVGVVGLIGNPRAYGEAFNICGDEVPSFAEVLETIGRYIKRDVVSVDLPTEFYAAQMNSYLAGEIIGGRAVDLTCSNEKIKSFVPMFKQTDTIEVGIAKTIEAYKRDHYQLGIDWQFDAETDRIIAKWLRVNRFTLNYKLDFCDYLHSGLIRDRMAYYTVRYSDAYLMKIFRFSRRVIRKVVLVTKGIFKK